MATIYKEVKTTINSIISDEIVFNEDAQRFYFLCGSKVDYSKLTDEEILNLDSLDERNQSVIISSDNEEEIKLKFRIISLNLSKKGTFDVVQTKKFEVEGSLD